MWNSASGCYGSGLPVCAKGRCPLVFNLKYSAALSRLLILLLASLFSSYALSAQLFTLVSDRAASEWAAAAGDFHSEYPDHRLVARTPSQFLAADAAQRAQWLDSDVVFAAGQFGEVVDLLLNHRWKADAQLIVVHSDRRLLQQQQIGRSRLFAPLPSQLIEQWRRPPDGDAFKSWMEAEFRQHPQYRYWLKAKLFWQQGGMANLKGLIAHLLMPFDQSLPVADVQGQDNILFSLGGASAFSEGYPLSELKRLPIEEKPTLILLDHIKADRAGDRELSTQICTRSDMQCIRMLSAWGEPTAKAIAALQSLLGDKTPKVVINLNDFVLGGGAHRESVDQLLNQWQLPVLKGIRLWEQTEAQWRASQVGLPVQTVHYRIAMPELQGQSQPLVLAALTPAAIDSVTGIELRLSQPIDSQVDYLLQKAKRWISLQQKANAEKRVAIVYYNHPPGRHNIGADNLNVPETLFHLLHQLKAAGYNTGVLPETLDDLLDLIQASAVNLPEDAAVLAEMAPRVPRMSKETYQAHLSQWPQALQQELIHGPLAFLISSTQQAIRVAEQNGGLTHDDRDLLQRNLSETFDSVHHLLEGADHPARLRALNLLDQLRSAFSQCLDEPGVTAEASCWQESYRFMIALKKTGIEGLRGWGEAPGRVMVWQDEILLPGLQLGNIFIGPQPPRGWELNEELLHANTRFPPPHQYVAFYHYLKSQFKADALVHLGRHSTYEFLPRKRTGLSADDYATGLIADLPSIYPYIVDGVGEGIQAKRRGSAVMIDHLTPPLVATPLYDDLLALRQLIESFEAAEIREDETGQNQAVIQIRDTLSRLNLNEELEASMAAELDVRGVSFDQVDDHLLVHEVGHYLTELQEEFMPLGLHVFGRDWQIEAVETLLSSLSEDTAVQDKWRQPLTDSPAKELSALLAALDGDFIAPGKGNDPIRTPEALPTGRNFYALDSSLIPSRLAYEQGRTLAREARLQSDPSPGEREAMVLWASDTVRDEGAMIAFALDMLGMKPRWSRRGILKGIERLDIESLRTEEPGRVRRDFVFTTSGLFRDLYGDQLEWLDRAVLMALDASSERIRQEYPSLSLAINEALLPLGELQQPGREPLTLNRVAMNWLTDAQQLMARGISPAQAGANASLRLFGTLPGGYGAGVNRVVERSGSWQHRSQVAEVYLNRMGYAYGIDRNGEAAHSSFNRNLANVSSTYLGRASNLYGLIDNNDAFDFLGGLNMAVEHQREGNVPDSWVIDHADRNNTSIKPLSRAMMQEFRGRYINPEWIKPLMAEGYAGARTMGSEFLEYLWGWQVTSPEIVQGWLWDDVKAVYVDDSLQLGLDEFLKQSHNIHVYNNMLAVMLVAAEKGFWQPDAATLQQLAEQFTKQVLEAGLPGSGHTNPDNSLYPWLEQHLSESDYGQLQALLASARLPAAMKETAPASITEIALEQKPEQAGSNESQQDAGSSDDMATEEGAGDLHWFAYLLLAGLLLVLLTGFIKGRRG